ncbi:MULTISPECIES: flavin reductase family protein [unclassified Streptomyces]|uniref:flavin reductase family protein n=1 Tax=unclassified Streptomyces TaxID=2593676 RepID=UPI00278C8FB3|nr:MULTISPECIES: flavin reductase family protein [unclassified Streptomyces]
MTVDHIPDIRPLMAGFPTGVTVLTALTPEGVPRGMTCTSLCSVALDPPTVLVCLRCGSPTLEAALASGGYTVNLLHSEARSTAELFASGAVDRFERVNWSVEGDARGPHLVESAHIVADCEVAETRTVGDHCVVFARVRSIRQLRTRKPLLYGMRRYGDWTESGEDSNLLYDYIS